MVYYGLALDTNAADIQPVGVTAAAGSIGKAADAGHVHAGLSMVATTGIAGFALQNGTPNILTWTPPNDGQMHRFTMFSLIHVTSAETGGLVQVAYFGPFAGAGQHVATIFNAALGTDTAGQAPANPFMAVVEPGSAVTLTQTSALTVGAATVWAEIWGS